MLKKMGMAVLSLMLVSQSAMAFNPQATVSWSRLNRDPYNWTYTAKVYADRYDSTIKARIEAYSYVWDKAGNEIAYSDTVKDNVNNVVLGKGMSSAYNNKWMNATVQGYLTYGPDGLIPYEVKANKVNNTELPASLGGISLRETVVFSQLKTTVAERDQAMVSSFGRSLDGYDEHMLLDYLMDDDDNIQNESEVFDCINLREGDSGLLLYESPDQSCVLVYKQDAAGINHEFEFTLADGQMKLTNSNTTRSTTPELDVQIERLSQELADC